MKLEDIKLPAKFKGSDKWWGGKTVLMVIYDASNGELRCESNEYFITQESLDKGLVTLIEEDLYNPSKKVISEWFGKKYRVTPETSKLLQEEVFKAGGKWSTGIESVQLKGMPFLLVSDNGKISYDSNESLFDIADKQEGVLELKLVLKEVIDSTQETVEINGKQYLKSDIDNLTPVK